MTTECRESRPCQPDSEWAMDAASSSVTPEPLEPAMPPEVAVSSLARWQQDPSIPFDLEEVRGSYAHLRA